MKFKNNKISHEHIYWDQASVLAQIGHTDNRNRTNKKLVELSKKN
jgi:hypothetical protein